MRRFRSRFSCGREELLLVQSLTFLIFTTFYMQESKKLKAKYVSFKFLLLNTLTEQWLSFFSVAYRHSNKEA